MTAGPFTLTVIGYYGRSRKPFGSTLAMSDVDGEQGTWDDIDENIRALSIPVTPEGDLVITDLQTSDAGTDTTRIRPKVNGEEKLKTWLSATLANLTTDRQSRIGGDSFAVPMGSTLAFVQRA
jgi:hypothetical protein